MEIVDEDFIKPDLIIRSRRKTLSILVNASGQLVVRAPLRCGEERIFSFVLEHQEWIKKYKNKAIKNNEKLPGENLEGYSFPVNGILYTIKYWKNSKVYLVKNDKIIYVPINDGNRKLVDWLKNYCFIKIKEKVKYWSLIMGVNYLSVTINSAHSLWGSCSFDNKLHFTFRCAYLPEDILDYLVVHELSHTKFKNHKKEFWNEVEKYIPNYKEKNNWLKVNSYLIRIF